MSGPMPYFLEKGPTFEVIEDFINSGGQRLIDAVELLRLKKNGAYVHTFVECGVFDTPALHFQQSAAESRTGVAVDWTPAVWRQHLDEHWFGIKDGQGKVVDPTQAKKLADAKSWWINYYGDNVQDILRETILRAIEAAYGVANGASLVNPPHDPWPVELFWKCGQSWFEGWITWRKLPGAGDRGLVTVLVCTPSEDSGKHYVWESPIPDPSDAAGRADPFPLGVGHLGQEYAGMVVVTHTDNLPKGVGVSQVATQQLGGLAPPQPGAVFHGTGPVVAVRPSEFRGGVRSVPRVWTPPPGHP